jgi:hypothetical protein
MKREREPKTGPVRTADEADGFGDSPEYLREWATLLVKTAGKTEARIALAGYKALAANKQLDKADRDVARKRAKALEDVL